MATINYAAQTTVSSEKSRAEIERTLIRFGASEFLSGWQEGTAHIGFRFQNHRVRFTLALPAKTERRFVIDRRGYRRADAATLKLWEQECRQRWRALALVVKAKLAAVEAKVATFEEEFLPYLAVGNVTVGAWIIPKLPALYEGKVHMPALEEHAGPSRNGDGLVIDGEVVR